MASEVRAQSVIKDGAYPKITKPDGDNVLTTIKDVMENLRFFNTTPRIAAPTVLEVALPAVGSASLQEAGRSRRSALCWPMPKQSELLGLPPRR